MGVAPFLVGALAGGICVAVVTSQPVPETKVIEGPTKYITKKEVETEYVTTPLPESCIKLADGVKAVIRQSNTYHTKARDMYARIKDIDLRVLEDQQTNNEAVIEVFQYLERSEVELMGLFESNEELKLDQQMCDEDLEEAAARADSSPAEP